MRSLRRERGRRRGRRRGQGEGRQRRRRAKLAKTAVRVGGAIRNPKKTKDVRPSIRRSRGRSRSAARCTSSSPSVRTARSRTARVLKSVPLLDQAALDAVKQWETRRPESRVWRCR